MGLKTVKEFIGLFAESPGLAILVVLAGLLVWVVRVDALGFVSRQKDKRRARVFDTYEKLKAMGGLTEADRESLVGELRGAGVGLPLESAAVDVREDEEDVEQGVVPLPRAATQTVRVADAILSTFGKLLVLGVFASMVLGGAGLMLAAALSKDPAVIAVGLFCGPWIVFGGMRMAFGLVRDAVEKYPRQLRGVAEWIDWAERRTELARSLGALGLVASVHVALVGFGVFLSYQLAVESESMLGWSFAAGIGVVTAAASVKAVVGSLTFFGVLEEREPEPSGS